MRVMHALRVLEFDAVRQRLAYHCETSLGTAAAEVLEPTFDRDDVWRQQALTAEAYELLAHHAPPSLGAVRDLRNALDRARKGGALNGGELYAVGEAFQSMRLFRDALRPRQESAPELWRHAEALPVQDRLERILFDSLDGDGSVKDGASPALTQLRQRKKTTNARLQERIHSYTSGPKRELLSDPIVTVRDGRYVIPLKAENRGKIRGIVHDTSSTGATVFLEPEDVLQLGNALREIEAAERAEEQKVLVNLSSRVGAVGREGMEGIEAAGFLDLQLAKAKLGFAMKASRPLPLEGHGIEIQGGRHPLIDIEQAVPLDLTVGREHLGVLITGPNTGGKTVALKTVGLYALMAQSGLMLPGLHIRFGPFTQVWADIGDEQSLQQSLSTFSGHIRNIAEALKFLRKGALVLFDELGAGTDPAEGAALARAILLTMQKKEAVIVASTHYGELKAFAYNTPGFVNAAMEFDPKTLRPTYRLLMGAPGASQALRIAERYGIPTEVVELAKEGLSEQQQDIALMLERLEQAQRQARIAQGEADRRLNELKRKESEASRKLAEADEIRRTANTKAQAVIEDALREIRLEAARLFDELKRAPQKTEDVRRGLKELQEVGGAFAKEVGPKKSKPAPASEPITKGMAVKVEGYTQVGTVLEEPKDGQAIVQMGILRMTVPVSDLRPSGAPTKAEVKPRTNLSLQKAQTAHTEIQLINMRAEDAKEELERFIDDAVLAGLHSVRIVHGKGEGILRKVTQDYLRRHKSVASYRDGEPGEGGAGVTIALFK